jgi:hypothetical protein
MTLLNGLIHSAGNCASSAKKKIFRVSLDTLCSEIIQIRNWNGRNVVNLSLTMRHVRSCDHVIHILSSSI